MSEKTTTHVDTPLGPSTQRALDAVRDLHAAGQIATREAVSELTGDRLSVVDDRLRVLADDKFIRRLARGAYMPMEQHPPPRVISKTLLPDGTVSYTRDGSFHLNSDGQLVTSNGFALEPAIVLPPEVQTFMVGEDGTVSVTTFGDPQPQVIGNIQTADFINPAGLQAIGNNLFLETGASGAPQVGTPGLTGLGTVLQNTLENSNVSVVEEMVNMITTQRAYEMNSKVVSTADQMLSFITQQL